MIVALLLLFATDAPGGDDWKYDVVVHRTQGPLRGLVMDHNARTVRIKVIRRRAGSPTLLFTYTFPRAEVKELRLLAGPDRKKLEQRLESLKRERELLASLTRSLGPGEKPPDIPTDVLELKKAAWPGDEKLDALRYRSAHFELIAACRPELVQLASLHLEQVYAAYARRLPPRTSMATPTTILLTRSLADYQAIARARGLNLFNPAFYDPARNQVVCGSDLDRLCDERDRVRAHHVKLRAGIRERRAELMKIYRNKPPMGLLAPLADAENRITRSEESNAQLLDRVRRRLFQRLYHEAFHAYLGTFVYPGKDNHLPVWFNEGLAQVFETAIVEAGELRIGHADEERLKAAQEALEKGTLPSLADLLKSGPRDFQVAHMAEQLTSDRHYLAAWALAHYLTFNRELLGTKALDDYVAALGREVGPATAFRELVGEPLHRFEAAWLAYLEKLRPNGKTGK